MTFEKIYTFANSPAGLLLIFGILTLAAACLFPAIAPAILGVAAAIMVLAGFMRLAWEVKKFETKHDLNRYG